MDQDHPSSELSNHFLIALDGVGLEQDYFSKTISLLVDHSPNGAFGLVINRPLTVTLAELLPGFQDQILCPVFEGGPVEPERLFFLHSPEQAYTGTLNVSAEISLSASEDLIEDLRSGKRPEHIIALLGYAGWGAAQLEGELGESIWLLTPTLADIVFTTPIEERRNKAAALLGVDLNLMNRAAGHD